MISIKPLLLALLFSETQASYDKIAGYEPKTSVTDHNAIDLDQKEIQTQVDLLTAESFSTAQQVYTKGGYSKSYAVLPVSGGVSIAIAAGTAITGKDSSGKPVYGKAMEAVAAGATSLKFQYQASEDQATYLTCQVGGLPDPNLVGCLAASGAVRVDQSTTDITYEYDPTTGNMNARTIQYFSTTANVKMRHNGEGEYYDDFQKFFNFYGTETYADAFITAAFGGTQTSFANGNADFSSMGYEGKAEAIKKGCAYMATAMYAIREIEDGIDACASNCANAGCSSDTDNSLDEGVAFYTGSQEGTDGAGDGYLFYSLADKRCMNFKTCGEGGNELAGTSKVNLEVFKAFARMRDNYGKGLCEEIRKDKELIVNKMKVPLVQGTLRYAYLTPGAADDEKGIAEGATFAAAVLPWVHACNADDAATIYKNMQTGQGGAAVFADVRAAFQRNYACMGISCSDVGGIWDEGNSKYFAGAEPCSSAFGLKMGLMATVAAVASMFMIF